MDENNRTQSAPSSDQHREKRARVPYQRTVPHITQDPITDDGITYQRRAQREAHRRSGSYPIAGARLNEAVGQRGQGYRGQGGQAPAGFAGEARQQNFTSAPGRKHMGVATSDPQYLQPTGLQNRSPQGPAHPRHKMPGDGEPQVSLGSIGSQDHFHGAARPCPQAHACGAGRRAHRGRCHSRVAYLLPLGKRWIYLRGRSGLQLLGTSGRRARVAALLPGGRRPLNCAFPSALLACTRPPREEVPKS